MHHCSEVLPQINIGLQLLQPFTVSRYESILAAMDCTAEWEVLSAEPDAVPCKDCMRPCMQ